MKFKRADISVEQLREWLNYDPETGILYWRHKHRGMTPGAVAGTKIGGSVKRPNQRHILVKINYLYYLAHRVAWAVHYGEWPNKFIDHINMDGWDNRIDNLRLASNAQNMHNRGPQRNNKSTGVKGVSAHQHGGYCANINCNGECHYLGYFKTLEEAEAAYKEAALRLHGKFARTK